MSREQAPSVPCPPDSLWILTDLIMDYMCCRFHAGICPPTHSTGHIPAEMVCEEDRMAVSLNPLTISQVMLYDFQLGTELDQDSAFIHNVASTTEHSCNLKWERCTHLSEPAILISESGEVIALYLHSAVSQYSQVCFHLEEFTNK
ncbi:hypothetical protein PAXRUDRAFT_160958 [Paxillus rubicundulus Ve08.2h10]|uniref:Unplaced genomic scaffold scaffold_1419, whole genome shotgun sequence n=1 Tax=Paxillus rubicundulus Ve08.2h10 TaxID=930991 RepID=A0A0D0DMC5_9AGAM|nr:hypothetical protein PAXRUDRAFT_160958 [Paxillus rubicundulus Ve08.2h10]